MNLPNAQLAVVEGEKIMDYLLNPHHRFGASKARFFHRHGFRVGNWERLAQALLDHGKRHRVSQMKETAYGIRYQIDGELHAISGVSPRIRTVWQLDRGRLAPRLITAYPLGKS